MPTSMHLQERSRTEGFSSTHANLTLKRKTLLMCFLKYKYMLLGVLICNYETF